MSYSQQSLVISALLSYLTFCVKQDWKRLSACKSACFWWGMLIFARVSLLQQVAGCYENFCCLCRESVWAALVFTQRQQGVSRSGFTACSNPSECCSDCKFHLHSSVLPALTSNCTSVQSLSGDQCLEASHAECTGPAWRLQPAELCLQCFG